MQCNDAAAKSLQSCPTLCDPIDSSPPGSPVPGILQARTLEWVAISESEVTQWCPTPSDPMDCSPPDPSVHGIFQARVLEWGAIAFSGLPVQVDIKSRGFNPWVRKIPWRRECLVQWDKEGNGTALQYSCLENPMDRGAQ